MLLRKDFLIISVNLLLLSPPFLLHSEQAAKSAPRAPGFSSSKSQRKSGIAFRHESGASAEKQMVETFGSGVGVINFDNDGYLDIYVTGYGDNQLFRNQGDGTFRDVTAKAGVAAGRGAAAPPGSARCRGASEAPELRPKVLERLRVSGIQLQPSIFEESVPVNL